METDFDYRGARYMDAEYGRFLSVDPLASDYAAWSTYNYVLGNPLSYVDPDGRSSDDLIVKYGKDCSCLDEFIKTLNNNLGDQFQATSETLFDKDGNAIEGSARIKILATEGGGDLSKLTKGGQNFVNGLKFITDNSKNNATIKIENPASSNTVATGNFNLETIDVSDVNQWPVLDQSKEVQEGPTQAGKILHEVHEQFLKQSYNSKFGLAHEIAKGKENGVNGNTRISDEHAHSGAVQRFKRPDGSVSRWQIWMQPKTIKVKRLKNQ